MAPFFRWHGHEGHWRGHEGHWHPHEGRRHWDRWQGREEPGPGPSPGPDVLQSVVSAATAPITAPLKAIGGLFGLEVEDPFPLSDEEAEMYPTRHRRPRSARYQSGDENSESGDEFAPLGEQMPQLTDPRTRWPWLQREEQVWQDDAWRALEFEASPSGPRFLVECPAGCPPVVAGRCITVVRQAIIEAIKMANDAANKLEAPTNLEISKRDKVKDKDAIETAGFFRSIFGHDPTRKVPWDDNKASGISVAKRFRAVANELGGGRRIVFRCVLDARANCTANDLTCCLPDDRAWTLQPLVPNVVHLCEFRRSSISCLRGFWDLGGARVRWAFSLPDDRYFCERVGGMRGAEGLLAWPFRVRAGRGLRAGRGRGRPPGSRRRKRDGRGLRFR